MPRRRCSTRRESQSKPDRGVVTVETFGFNQRGEEVCYFRRRVMVPKREAAKATAAPYKSPAGLSTGGGHERKSSTSRRPRRYRRRTRVEEPRVRRPAAPAAVLRRSAIRSAGRPRARRTAGNKYFANVGPFLAVVFIPVAGADRAVAHRSVRDPRRVRVRGRRRSSASSSSMIARLGVYNMALMLTAGQTPDIGKAFQNDRWGEWIVFSFVYGLMVGVGLALCVVPGLFVLAFFGLRAVLLPRPADEPRRRAQRELAEAASTGSVRAAGAALRDRRCRRAILCGIGLLVTVPRGVHRGRVPLPVRDATRSLRRRSVRRARRRLPVLCDRRRE